MYRSCAQWKHKINTDINIGKKKKKKERIFNIPSYLVLSRDRLRVMICWVTILHPQDSLNGA